MLTCSQASLHTGEPLYGTAEKVDVWLMLEYNLPWRAKATKDNNLPLAVKAWLAEQIDELERDHGLKARLQFISQDRKYRGAKLSYFIGVNHHTSPKLYKHELDHYDNLETLNLAALVDDGSEQEHQEPAYFVCTNGRRDQCCAIHGTPIYLMLAKQVGAAAWRTTHIGGHRFAGNVLTLPIGASYGRVSRHDVAKLVEATNTGSLFLENLRGRTCFKPYEQTAEYVARIRTGQSSIKVLQWTGAVDAEVGIDITFKDVTTDQNHNIRLMRSEAPLNVLGSCGDDAPKQVWTYTEV